MSKLNVSVAVPPELPKPDLIYPIAMCWKGNVDDAVLFLSETVAIRITGGYRVGDLRKAASGLAGDINVPTHESWTPMPKGTVVKLEYVAE